MPWTTPETFTAGQTLTAASMNAISGNLTAVARGVVGRASVTANQAGVTSVTDITGLSVTWTAEATRLYRTTIYAQYQHLTTTGIGWVRLTDGSGTQITQWINSDVVNGYYTATLVAYETGLSGSVTRKARAEAQAGSITIIAAANYPAFILIEDIGEA